MLSFYALVSFLSASGYLAFGRKELRLAKKVALKLILDAWRGRVVEFQEGVWGGPGR